MKRLRTIDLPPERWVLGHIIAEKARLNGDKPYLRFEGEVYSYADVDEITNRLANGMTAFGLNRGEHAAVMVDNCPETLWTNFALAKMGAVAVPVNSAARGDLLSYTLTQSDSAVLFIGARYLDRFLAVRHAVPGVTRIVIVPERDDGGELPGARDLGELSVGRYEDLARAGAAAPLVALSPEDLHSIAYTSGTTGPSKGVAASHRASIYFSLGRAEYLGFQPDDVVYTCLPLFHGNAMAAACVPALLADSTVALARRFSASRFWDDVRENGVTQFNLLSSMTNILWSQPESARDRDNRVRQCTMVPVPDFAEAFEQRFGIRITSSFSLTDFGQGTFLQAGFPKEKRRSAGLPRPGVEIAIHDDDDRPVPRGGAGEICLRNAGPESGRRFYYKMPEVNEEANRSGWFHTGDRGYLDEDGYLFFVDRKKDAIRRRGENISSWEVEQILSRYPGIAEVAVFPVRSEMSEDEVMVSVVPQEGRTIDPVDLIRFCEANMAYFMVPRFLEFLPELPKTMTEKVQKNELKARAEERLDLIWDRERLGITIRR